MTDDPKNPGGRPTKLTPEMIEKAQHYLENWNLEEYDDAFPNIAGLSRALQINRTTCYQWADLSNLEETEENQELAELRRKFSNIVDDVSTEQERVLWTKGLRNEHNASLTKLALTKHGYHDHAKNEISTPEGGMSINVSVKGFGPE